MRTTLSLDDDVFQVLKTYAEKRSLAMGKALSELVRRGLSAPPEEHGSSMALWSLTFPKTLSRLPPSK